MNNLKLWALSLCGALVVTSIFRILMSNSQLKKSINIFLSMFIFLYSVVPIGKLFSADSFNTDFSDKSFSYDDYYENTYEQIIIKAIKNVCETNCVTVVSIEINAYVDENEYYCINEIDLQIDENNKTNEIKNELKNIFGFEVNVY